MGLHTYKAFCTNANRWEIPASEITLLLSSPTSQLLNYKGLPAAIHNAHVAQGDHKDFMEASTPHLQQVMKGIQREQAIVKYQRVCKPITITIIS